MIVRLRGPLRRKHWGPGVLAVLADLDTPDVDLDRFFDVDPAEHVLGQLLDAFDVGKGLLETLGVLNTTAEETGVILNLTLDELEDVVDVEVGRPGRSVPRPRTRPSIAWIRSRSRAGTFSS